jgi:hypothetical protein
LKNGLPKIFQDENELQDILRDHTRFSNYREEIRDKIIEFKTSNLEPSGEDPALIDFDSFSEDKDFKYSMMKLIAFHVEGSSKTLKDLRARCYQSLINDHFPEYAQYLLEYNVEQIIVSFALRKSYGVKPKNTNIFSDSTPTGLWCWEVQELDLLEPVSKAQINKART